MYLKQVKRITKSLKHRSIKRHVKVERFQITKHGTRVTSSTNAYYTHERTSLTPRPRDVLYILPTQVRNPDVPDLS